MGTVKYSGPVASFHCPTNAEIRSLKVHFSPKQEGTGDPSPSNVREITGWTGVSTYKRKKNLLSDNVNDYKNNVGGPDAKKVPSDFKFQNGEYSGTVPNAIRDYCAYAGQIAIPPGTYTLSFDYINGVQNYSWKPVICSYDNTSNWYSGVTSPAANQNSGHIQSTFTATKPFYVNIVLNSFANTSKSAVNKLYNLQLELASTATPYEPYRGGTTNYTFGVLGKNKFPASDGTTSDIFLAANTTYTFSATSSSAGYFKGWYEDGTDTGIMWINGGSDGDRRWKSYTITQNIVKGVFFLSGGMSECQIELGSSATTYEPYNPNHTVYGGWVDLISGEVTKTWTVRPISQMSVTKTNGTGVWQHRFDLRAPWITGVGYEDAGNAYKAICSVFSLGTAETNFTYRTYAGLIDVYDDTTETAEDFKTKYGDNSVAYAIRPELYETYSLAPTQLQTFLGTNNVWSNADYVEVEYDLHETQDILARKQFIMASQPHVEEASGAIATFTTDMAAKLKECKVGFKPVQDLHGYNKPWVGGAGKNLFNINAVEQDPDNTALSNSSVRKFNTGTYAKGASYYNYWQAGQIIECTINNNAITVSATTGYGVGFPIKMKEGTTYFISCAMTGNSSGQINIAPYDVEGNYLGDAVLVNYVNQTYTAPANIDIGVIILRNQTSRDNPISTTFSNIQIEVGSTATSYEPYENICPIEGWNGIIAGKASKNLLDIMQNNRINHQDYTCSSESIVCAHVLGWNSTHVWFEQIFAPGTYTISCDYSGEGTNGPRLICSTPIDGGTWNNSYQGYWKNFTGRSCTFTATESFSTALVFISRTDHNGESGTFYNIQLELGSSATEYEPYNGETIPITFPTTKNLFDEVYDGITSESIIYRSIYVGDNVVIASTTTPRYYTQDAPSGYSNLFVFPDQVTSGASTGMNDICVGTTRTITPVDGYITIAYRNRGGVDPRDYHTQIEVGSTATAYEPYRTIYGGYVDLTTGEMWKTHEMINLPVAAKQGTWDSTAGKGAYWYTSGIQKLATTNDGVLCNRCTPILNTTLENTTSVISWYSNDIIRWIDIGTMEMTVAEYRNYLAENPLQVTYKLNTPVLVGTLSPSQLKSLRGINNIYSNTNDNITVKYWKH